jgi:hypothetical protein
MLTSKGRGIAMVVGVIVCLYVVALGLSRLVPGPPSRPPQQPTERERNLAVSAGRHFAGLEVTNRENTHIYSCRIAVLDEGNSEWMATAHGPIYPSQTVSVRWDQFKQSGQPMPAYIGQNRQHVVVSCMVGGQRRSAGLRF